MHLNLHQLDAFARVARLGGFSRAADQMHLSQAGLSILIRKLETRLSVQLFERNARGVTLTASGRGLLPIAERMLQDAQTILNNSQQLAEQAVRRITVALPPLLASTVLPGVLSQFQASHPTVNVSFRECVGDELVHHVYTRGADFAMTFQPADNGELESLPLGRDQLCVAHTPDHPLSQLPRVRWSDLVGLPIIVNTPGSVARMLAEDAFASMQEPLQPAFETGNHMTSVVLAGEGLGVAIVSSTVQGLALSMNAVVRTLIGPQITRSLQVLKRRGSPLTEPARAFVDLFGKAATREMSAARTPISRRPV